jgi:hypothetical protein
MRSFNRRIAAPVVPVPGQRAWTQLRGWSTAPDGLSPPITSVQAAMSCIVHDAAIAAALAPEGRGRTKAEVVTRPTTLSNIAGDTAAVARWTGKGMRPLDRPARAPLDRPLESR